MYDAGNRLPGSAIDFPVNTTKADGTPETLDSPTLVCYKGNSTTEDSDGLSITADFDGRVGLNHIHIDTSADPTFYAAGNDFFVVLSGGTVDGISVVGRCIGTFSLNNRSVASVTGNVVGSVASVSGNVGGNVVGSVASVSGNVGGNVVGSVASVSGNVTLSSSERNSIADAHFDRADAIETGRTFRKIMRLVAAVLLGKSSGFDDDEPVFRNVGDSKDRVTATVTSDGRTAMTYDDT